MVGLTEKFHGALTARFRPHIPVAKQHPLIFTTINSVVFLALATCAVGGLWLTVNLTREAVTGPDRLYNTAGSFVVLVGTVALISTAHRWHRDLSRHLERQINRCLDRRAATRSHPPPLSEGTPP